MTHPKRSQRLTVIVEELGPDGQVLHRVTAEKRFDYTESLAQSERRIRYGMTGRSMALEGLSAIERAWVKRKAEAP